jgi:hypothetical protein
VSLTTNTPAPDGHGATTQTKEDAMKFSTLAGAIEMAMEQFIEDGCFTPHDPAICRDGDGFRFESKLNGDEVIIDLSSGFGSWTPDTDDDIPALAAALAAEIEAK